MSKLTEAKQALVSYFQDLGYLTYGNQNKKVVYLYSKDAKFQIVKVALTAKAPSAKKDATMDYLRQKLRDQLEDPNARISVYNIYLTEKFKDNFVREDDESLLIATNWNYLVQNLKEDFVDIEKLTPPTETVNSDRMNHADFNIEDVKTPEELNQRLKLLNGQLKNQPAIGSIILYILFIIVPVVVSFVAIFMVGYIGLGAPQQTSNVQALMFGATNYQLTMLGGQWWRFITYGLSGGGSNIVGLVMLIIIAIISFKRLRLNELIMGTWQMLITYFLAYLLTGFFMSVFSLTPIGAMSGVNLAIITGMIALNTGGSKSAVATFAKKQIIWPVIILIFLGFFGGSGYGAIALVTGFILGGIIAMLFTYNYKAVNWRLAMAILVLLAFIVIPLVFLLIPSYIPGTDFYTVHTLTAYVRMNLMSPQKATDIADKIGWNNVSWSKDASGIVWVSYK